MKRRSVASYKGPVSRDRQQLAAHVAALLGAALQPSCSLNAKSCESVSNVLLQLDLPWYPDHFSLRICNADDLDKAVKASNAAGFTSLTVKVFLADLAQEPVEQALSQLPSRQALAALAMRFPNFMPVVDYLLRRAALAFLQPRSPLGGERPKHRGGGQNAGGG